MTGVFAAEWLKLRKRPATLIIGVIWLALVLLLGYLLPYLIFKSPSRARNGGPPLNSAALIAGLQPRNLVRELVPGFSNLGGTLILILAALVGGSEYGWTTLKTIFTQRPSRLTVFAGKLLALALVLVVFVVGGFVAAAVGSLVVALVEHAAVSWAPLADIVKGAGAMLLIFAAWATLGLGLAVLFRSTALAIGLGLVYALVVESLISAFSGISDIVKTVSKGLLGSNAGALVDPFRSSTGGFRAGGGSPLVGVGQAAITLGIYVVVFTLLAAFLLQRRDVT